MWSGLAVCAGRAASGARIPADLKDWDLHVQFFFRAFSVHYSVAVLSEYLAALFRRCYYRPSAKATFEQVQSFVRGVAPYLAVEFEHTMIFFQEMAKDFLAKVQYNCEGRDG